MGGGGCFFCLFLRLPADFFVERLRFGGLFLKRISPRTARKLMNPVLRRAQPCWTEYNRHDPPTHRPTDRSTGPKRSELRVQSADEDLWSYCVRSLYFSDGSILGEVWLNTLTRTLMDKNTYPLTAFSSMTMRSCVMNETDGDDKTYLISSRVEKVLCTTSTMRKEKS